jgi:hypothetical protein
MDDFDFALDDLAIDEVRELLLELGADVSQQQVEELARFVTQAGSVETALQIMSQLVQQRAA